MKRLEQKGLTKILLHLKECSTESDVAKGQKREAVDALFDVFLQKINYMHLNVFGANQNLQNIGRILEYSSARFM
jgi:hypothetical protein